MCSRTGISVVLGSYRCVICAAAAGTTTLAAFSTRSTASALSISSRTSHRKYSTRRRAQPHTHADDVIRRHVTPAGKQAAPGLGQVVE